MFNTLNAWYDNLNEFNRHTIFLLMVSACAGPLIVGIIFSMMVPLILGAINTLLLVILALSRIPNLFK